MLPWPVEPPGYAKDHGVFTFTSVTVYEIVYGLELKGASSQLQKVLAWLKQNEEITPSTLTTLRQPPSRQRQEGKAMLLNSRIV